LAFGTTHQEERWNFQCYSQNGKNLIFIENADDISNIIFPNKTTKNQQWQNSSPAEFWQNSRILFFFGVILYVNMTCAGKNKMLLVRTKCCW